MQSWRAIESNPEVFTDFVAKLGKPDLAVVDVFSFDDEYVGLIPQV